MRNTQTPCSFASGPVPRTRRKIGILRWSGPIGLAILLQMNRNTVGFLPQHLLPMEEAWRRCRATERGN